MKYHIQSIFLVLLMFGCNSSKRLYNAGIVDIKEETEVINLTMVNNLPFCKVEIGGKIYNFLVDTGAPTVISEEIFQSLKLTEVYQSTMSDTHQKTRQEKFTIVPQIKIGNLTIKNLASVVVKFESNELKCFGLDGIVGANLLAHLFCEINYHENKILVSKNRSKFNTEKYDFILNFKTINQKTPIVKGKIFDKQLSFTFDTGFSGNIKIPNDLNDNELHVAVNQYFISNGISSIGAYGKGDIDKTMTLKSNFYIGNTLFKEELMDTGESTLIGNVFLKNYIFLIDWKSNKIYLKSINKSEKKQIRGFGFSYLFENGKAIVVSKIEDKNIPINLGDEIIRIDDVDFTKIRNEDICKFYLNKVEHNKEKIDITIKRNQHLFQYNLMKQTFIK